MTSHPFPPLARWPFYLGDVIAVAAATWVALQGPKPLTFWSTVLVFACVALGAFLGVLPHLSECAARDKEIRLATEPGTESPIRSQARQDWEHEAKELAEIAVLAWKIQKRAEKEPNPPKPILRNAGRIIELLSHFKLEVISYAGQKIDMGSRVEVMEAVEDEEENRVLAEHEPEIQVDGRLVRKAILSVGKGKTPPASASPGDSNTKAKADNPPTQLPQNPPNKDVQL